VALEKGRFQAVRLFDKNFNNSEVGGLTITHVVLPPANCG
jgi:hypothetical protein